MSGGASPWRAPSQFLEGAVPTDDFYPLPEYVASLIPPAAQPVSFDRFVAEPGFGDERGRASYIAAPPEGSGVGAAEGGDQGLGSSVEDGGAQETGSGINGCYAEELGSVAGGAHDLDSGFDTDVAQERSRGVGDAGVGYKKRFRGREGSDVRVGPPREVGAVELALRNSSTRKTKYILEPVVGTSFDSLAEAHEFYNLYSWEVGFGIRYGKNYTNGKNYRSSQQLICQMEGIDKRDKNDSARCGCKAMIRLHRSDDDGWFVETNRPDHNHILTDNCGEKMQWNSHKKIDQATKDTVRYLREINVSLSKVHCILGSMHKSGDRLPFTKKSLRTVCQQIAFDQKDDDIKKTIDLFRSMRSTDPDFAFRFDLDPDGRIKNLIWTSGRSRRQYTCFGDVVVFDTTYTTNLYKMPFGLFVGVNNHFQTVIYAGILMSEETIEGFNWAYKEFVSLMGGKAPLTMLTDQCRAMEVAIGMTLPGTIHRWCKWHVFRKAKEELGGIFSKQTGFKDAFNNVVNEMLTIDEFEKAWGRLIEDFGLVENSFMIRAFEARHKWAKPYFKDKYCARMTSTQRVESANHMLKTYVPRNSSMNKFVSQYNKLLKDRNEAEDSEEHKNKQCNRKERGGWPIEKHARRIYTRAVMKHFKAELERGQNFNPPKELEALSLYELEHSYSHLRPSWARTTFRVRVEGGERFQCDCGLFGHFGIMCGHVIRLMIHLGLNQIPNFHIMKRWTKSARDILGPNVEGPSDTEVSLPKSFRHNIMYVSALELVKMGDLGESRYRIVMKHITALKKELRQDDTPVAPLYYSSGGEDEGEGRRSHSRTT
ncbi:protein FAR1-RELATED SEQUENCE 5-like [Lolium rigidum]|uniref:protein FAR1-RELATED SEQUENCE 5-like n=1 Tax=Lolium rigidum TaxID=89674 RepID=UPI001F5CB796|nr:protein FAR1-RELATED SEQUENCE 5-like [Lolium rigidum]